MSQQVKDRLKLLYYAKDGFHKPQELQELYNSKYKQHITLDTAKSFVNDQYINQVFKSANPKLYKANPKFQVSIPNQIHVIDTLSVYKDKKTGYKYILTLVDIASRYKAGAPLKGKKPAEIVDAIKKIYKDNPDLKIPERIIADAGSEFKSDFARFCEENNITLQISPAHYHRSQGHVEVLNAMLAQQLYKIIETPEEDLPENFDQTWPANLQAVLDRLNTIKYRSIKMSPKEAIKREYVQQPKYSKKELARINANKFQMYDKVRYLLPKDDPEFGLKRRATDPVWSTGIYTIYAIHENGDDNPTVYHIQNDHKTIPYGFTSIQLQPVTDE